MIRSRRFPFLLALWMAVALLWCGGMVSLIASGDDAVRVERQAYVMGTRVRLVTLASDRAVGLQRLERLLGSLEQTERELSTWDPSSLLSQLNRHPVARPWQVPEALCDLFSELFRWHRETAGAFDPGVGSLIEAWAIREGGRVPSPHTVEAALARAGLRHFSWVPDSCTVTRTLDATFDAGAFGKGAALDRVARLERRQAGPWLVDLGGQIAAWDEPGSEGWSVAVAHPASRETPAFELRLTRGSIAVSGGSERDHWVQGRQVGHILDPRTWRPVSRGGAVAVWHPRALVADVLSTALYVMGAGEGLAWATSRGVAACFIAQRKQAVARTPDLDLQATPTFEQRFSGACSESLATPILANP